ncbi:hypothetical protein ACH4S9_19745 [Streptomyces sp. NPDC021225]
MSSTREKDQQPRSPRRTSMCGQVTTSLQLQDALGKLKVRCR